MRALSAALGAALLLPLLVACGSTPVAPSTEEASAATAPALDRAATLSIACSGCHSAAGGAIPALEGRTEASIRDSLLAYKSAADGTTVMHRMMRGYSDADIDAISAYLAGSTMP